jgi:hypothetical protein
MNLWSLFWTEVISYQSETSNPRKPKSRQYIFWEGLRHRQSYSHKIRHSEFHYANRAFKQPLLQHLSVCLQAETTMHTLYFLHWHYKISTCLYRFLYTTSKQILHHDYHYLPSSSCECTVAVQSTDTQLDPHRLQMYAGWC